MLHHFELALHTEPCTLVGNRGTTRLHSGTGRHQIELPRLRGTPQIANYDTGALRGVKYIHTDRDPRRAWLHQICINQDHFCVCGTAQETSHIREPDKTGDTRQGALADENGSGVPQGGGRLFKHSVISLVRDVSFILGALKSMHKRRGIYGTCQGLHNSGGFVPPPYILVSI